MLSLIWYAISHVTHVGVTGSISDDLSKPLKECNA